MSETGDLIFSGEHLRATLFNGEADKLLVTFSFREKGRTDFNPAHMSASAASRGFAQICIATRQNDWFINDDMLALEAVLKSLSSLYNRVYLMGFSMGGYGAFRFSRSVRANFILAISPQFSIHPDVVPFDGRFRDDAANFDRELGDLVAAARTGVQGVIVVDPFRDLDLVNAQMITEVFPRIKLARLGFGGHPATALLRRANKSGVVQQMAFEAPPRPEPIIAEHREARLDDPDYLVDMLERWQAR